MAAVALARPWLRHVPYWGINVLAAARWLAAAGSLDSAALLLPWWQAMLPGADFVHSSEVLWAPSILEAARVEAARGNQDLAREQYREFLRIYDAPNPRLQYLVDDARTALRKLE